MKLEWSKEPSYGFSSDDAEFAWCEGSDDYHWAVYGGRLALFDNEYDRAFTLSLVAGRTHEETKALAQRLEDALEGKDPLDPDRLKVAVCEYLLTISLPDGFIPPTAIDWIGNGIVDAILRSVVA